MTIDLVPTTASDAPVLGRLLQLYAYDFSEMTGADLGSDGLFPLGPGLSPSWSDPRRHSFVLRVGGHPGGFAILDEGSRLTGDSATMDVAEFFVMRKYRRQRIGSEAAARAFDLFPRPWEVRQMASNAAATAFWRSAIRDYTAGQFQETFVDDERWRGPVQSFDGRAR
jgi:predicted acetyltransferase